MIRHIYAEEAALTYPLTAEIISKLPRADVIKIKDANDIFKRPNQDYALQKENQALILAVNRGNFIYEASDNCQSFGSEAFRYCSVCRNCIYGCDYCYLQGMFRCGYLLAFVNTDDCFKAVNRLLEENKGKKILLPISYDSDIYALEDVFGYIKAWSDYLEERKPEGLTVEIRTKCGTKAFLDNVSEEAGKYMAFTWSLNPESIISRFERRTSPLRDRLSAMEEAISRGLTVRAAIDPIIAVDRGAPDEYAELVQRLGSFAGKLDGISLGTFRIPADFLKIMRKNAPRSPLAWDTYEVKNGTTTYRAEISEAFLKKMKAGLIDEGFDENKIFM